MKPAQRFSSLLLLASLLLFSSRPAAGIRPEAGPFTDAGVGLASVAYSTAAWGDFDNDGDLDVVVSGSSGSTRTTTVYRNRGAGSGWTFGEAASLQAVDNGSAAWGDFDNDGDLDILLTGSPGEFQAFTRLYRNDGPSGEDGWAFTAVNTGLPAVSNGGGEWGDFDNDGDLDILLAGMVDDVDPATLLYRNNGPASGWSFSATSAGLEALRNGQVTWADFDVDGDLDILLTGTNLNQQRFTRLYRNDGPAASGWSFSLLTSGLAAMSSGAAAWGDFDNDGDPDLLLSGEVSAGLSTQLYRNEGSSGELSWNFSPVYTGLPGVFESAQAWGDYDNDGDLDLILTGFSNTQFTPFSKVYRNSGAMSGGWNFVDVSAELTAVGHSAVAWGDYDNDADLDLVLSGSSSVQALTRVYRNTGLTKNSLPAAPTGLTAQRTGSSVTLSWNMASDNQTPANGLQYNLRVGTTSGGGQVLAPMAANSGYRRAPLPGNAQHSLSLTLRDLPPETIFYWSVQAIDTAWSGSAFSTEGSFNTIAGEAPKAGFSVSSISVLPGEVVTFTNTSTGTPPLYFLWDFGDTITTTLESPTHTFALPGTYAVHLTASSLLGSDELSQEVVVRKDDPQPPKFYVYLPVTRKKS